MAEPLPLLLTTSKVMNYITIIFFFDPKRLATWLGSDCSSVVASDSRGPRFESSRQQNLYVLSNYC